MTLLMRDFDLTAVQAAAIMGNIGHDVTNSIRITRSASQRVEEVRMAKWTGPRRQKFFNWLARTSGVQLEE